MMARCDQSFRQHTAAGKARASRLDQASSRIELGELLAAQFGEVLPMVLAAIAIHEHGLEEEVNGTRS